MSGWIKLEKDLESDPRVLRMAKALDRVTPDRNAGALHPVTQASRTVTLVIGALGRLWMYADSHARDDDTLDMSVEEIDQWLGLPGFCAVMPPDWLSVVDEGTVELPGFQEHNGTEAKRKDLNAKRQARHRKRSSRTSVTGGVTGSNAGALPDQTKTRPDQTHTHTRAKVVRLKHGKPATHGGGDQTPETDDDSTLDDADLANLFATVRLTYPKRGGRMDWLTAEHHWRQRIDEGVSAAEMLDGVTRYAAFVEGGGVSGPQYILGPEKFFQAREAMWRETWAVPAAKPNGNGKRPIGERLAALAGGGDDEFDEGAHA